MTRSTMSRPTVMFLRTLAVAGFAGVAWLLSGGTAHAAVDHRAPGADDPSVVNVVSGLLAENPEQASLLAPVTHVLDAATRPVPDQAVPAGTAIDPAPAAPSGVPASGAATSQAADPADPGPTGGPSKGAGDGAGDRGLSGLLQGLVGPLGAAEPAAGRSSAGGPLSGVLAPLTGTLLDPLGQVLRPVTQVLEPLTGVLRPVTTLVTAGTGTLLGTVGRGTSPVASAASPSAAPNGVRIDPVGPANRGLSPEAADPCAPEIGRQHTSSAIGQPAGAESGTAGNPAAGRGTDVPEWPFRAPFGAYPGGGSGSGTSGSGFPTGGGAFALAPYATVHHAVDSHRARPANDVEVLWLVAQAPTVSPD